MLVPSAIVIEPHGMEPGARSQIVDMPVGPCGDLLVMRDAYPETSRSQRVAYVNVIPVPKLHHPQAPDLNASIACTGENQRIGSGLRFNFRPCYHLHDEGDLSDWPKLGGLSFMQVHRR